MIFTLTSLISSFFACIHQPVMQEIITPEIPLYRSSEDGTRFFIEVEMDKIGKQYFMVDTGSSVSTIRTDLVNAMDLHINQKQGHLQGIAGTVPWIETTVPKIEIGGRKLEKVAFAVGVSGIPTYAGLVPIAGILGNNVWENFVMEIDYGQEYMRLYDSYSLPESAQPFEYDGQHILMNVELGYTHDGQEGVQTILSNLDTGSSGLIVNRLDAPQLLMYANNSKEPILGVGSSKDGNSHIVDTEQAVVQSITMGGYTQIKEQVAVLYTPPEDQEFVSLIGYELLENHRLIIDFANGLWMMTPSTFDSPIRNIHQSYLENLLWGNQERNPLEIIQLHFALNQDQQGLRKLRYYMRTTNDERYDIMLAQYYFQQGDITQSIDTLEKLDQEVLIQYGYMSSLLLAYAQSNRLDKAERTVNTLVESHPDESGFWFVKAYIHLLQNQPSLAKLALFQARQYTNPESFLVMQALIAQLEGNLTATVSYLRSDIQIHRLGNHSLWFLAQISHGTEFETVARQTLEENIDLIYSNRSGLDFLAAAYWELGEIEKAEEIANIGIKRDCSRFEKEVKANCDAWFHALIHKDIDKHIAIMEPIVARYPGRADYMDTLAVLYKGNKDYQRTQDLSKQAMLLSGSDPYMMWQALLK